MTTPERVTGEGKPLRSGRWFSAPEDVAFQHRMSLRAAGHAPERIGARPIIGIANSWNDFNNCNLPHRQLVEAVKRGVLEAGGYPMEFHTISTAADLTKPSDLPYRNLMAMDLEEMARAHPVDGLVLLCECDKTCPAQLMAAASLNLPSLQLAAGHRASGRFQGERVTYATDFWRFWERYRAGALTSDAWRDLEGCLSPSAGGCAVMGTASTMKSLSECLGMMLPGTSDVGATDPARVAAAEATGRRIVAMVEEDLCPSALLTEAAFRNAARVLAALGGSTNVLIHLTAIARRRAIAFTLDDFARAFDAVPLLANLQPNGPYNMDDFHAAGGLAALMGEMLPLLDGRCRTATGQTLGEVYGDARSLDADVIHPLASPAAVGPSLSILRGSLAPAGAVLKRSAASAHLLRHRGRAVVFDGYEQMLAQIDGGDLGIDAQSVLILRNCGPVGAPGMPEWGSIPVPERLLRQGVTDLVRISDARMSGTGYGTVALHVAPEAAVGGPLALVQTGDSVALDAIAGRLDLCLDEAALDARRKAWRPPPAMHLRGYMRLFSEHVLQAPDGCDLDFMLPESIRALERVEPVVGRG